MNKYDVVIIGSGLGGLLSGIILGKAGYSVCILEKHHQVGGNIQTFKRQSCTFSTGMHYIGSLDEGQVLNKIFKYFGILDKINVRKLDEKCFEKIYIGDEEYCYPMGLENFKAQMIKYFPEEIEAIEKYMNKINSIWENMNILNLRPVNSSDIFKQDTITENAYQFINSITQNKKLKALLAATNGLYAGVKAKTPIHVHAIINKFFLNSAYKLDERDIKLSTVLKSRVEDYGGRVFTNKEVNEVICEDAKAIAVKTSDNTVIYGSAFISDMHPANTLKLIDSNMFRKVYINRISDLENSVSCFCLYIILKNKSFKHINSNIYYSSSWDVWGVDTYNENDWPKGCILYTTLCKDNEEFAESITAITYMKYDEVKKWEGTKVEKRGDEYLEFKTKKAEDFIGLIEKKFPDIRQHIHTYYTSSPLTFQDYTGMPHGSMYGVLKNCNNHMKTFISHNTKISNLYLTGQNINLHGMLGVTVSSLVTCSSLIDLNKLINEIKNA